MLKLPLFIRHPWVPIQNLHTTFHWNPREEQLLSALDAQFSSGLGFRIIDIGCGNGLLAPSVVGRDFDYLGIDFNPGFIEYCKTKYQEVSKAQFVCANAQSLSNDFKDTDIVVLNGVFHHLSSEQVASMLDIISAVGSLIILDHDGVTSGGVIKNVQRLIQKLDRGKFVRPAEYFQNLKGWTVVQSRHFIIRLGGFPLWPYLCNVYKKNA